MTYLVRKDFNYDFDEGILSGDMSNKLFCTFCTEDQIDSVIEQIKYNYDILYNKIFVLECSNQDEFLCTYNVDPHNVNGFLDDTILVHRKKQTNTLYTINALNELIKELNGGVLDKRFSIEWDNYRNSILLTKEQELQILETKLYRIEEIR